jgi:4-hydroxy-3-polyprenylbenzoate decarboxylase
VNAKLPSNTERPETPAQLEAGIFSRRNFLALTAGMAAAGCATSSGTSANASIEEATAAAAQRRAAAPKPPFDSLRDYVAALEAYGLLLRFDKVDQDAYEGTAIVYALIDKYGWYDAPAVLFESVRQDGVWIKGPVLINHEGHWDTESILFGLEPVQGDSRQSYRNALAYTRNLLVDGKYPQIPPVEVSKSEALCKQVIETGDAIDITKFAFIKSNPADGGRYVNTGSLFTSDPDMGVNFGTYRCQIRGPRILGVNPEPNQTGWKMLTAARRCGPGSAGLARQRLESSAAVWQESYAH